MSPTHADNLVTWDRAVIVAALVVGIEIDLSRLLLVEIHDSVFKTTTTFPFACMIFQISKDARVPIFHFDKWCMP